MSAPKPTLESVLADELRKAETAYLAAGSPGEWPQWYAHRLEGTFGDTFGYDELLAALIAASTAHGIHETEELGGVRDEQWPEWYAAHMADSLSGARARFAAQLAALEDWA